MFKRLSTIFIVALMIPLLLTAQDKKKAPVKMNEPAVGIESVIKTGGTPITAANYAVVDTMPNAFGPAIGVLNPLDHDIASGVTAVVHRGKTTYAVGSGELWYNYSTDMGMTWNRSATSVQDGQTATNAARYPSSAISNPTGSTNLADLLYTFAWPDLGAGGFENVGYGADLGFDGADLAVIFDDPVQTYSSQVPTWANDAGPEVYWASDNSGDASIRLWYTDDLYTTINVIDVPQWSDSIFGSGGNITNGGVAANGVQYYSVLGTFLPEQVGGFNAPGGWEPGYSKSTDNGATWSDFNVIDWTLIPATAAYTEMWDYIKEDAFVSYQGDVNVDADGYVHIVTGLTKIDSAVSSEYGENALVEFIETASGWDAKIIFDDQDYLADSTFTQNDGMALGQMGPSVYLATNETRDVFVAQWVTSGTPGDTACDVWMSWRLATGDWNTPMNLTETAIMNENSSHLAPKLAQDGNTVTAFSFYCYPAGNTGFDISNTDPAVMYIAPVEIDITAVSVGDDLNKNYSYSLNQNYPNPFNPSTKITYTVPETGMVTLKVYDVLGKEVATLVNRVVNSGQHVVNFNAENLSTGIYFYELSAGEFVQTNKMMLLK
jgi:type IX secretion system substrate protein